MILDDVSRAPNPQFARLPFNDLSGRWQFAFDDDDRGIADRWFLPDATLDVTIEVPYPPESEMSGVHDVTFHPICWYKRSFADPRTRDDERLLLRFGAVDYRATVWVDGTFVGEHEGGSTPFAIDISSAIDGSRSDHVITVRVVDEPEDTEQPRGKQTWHDDPQIIFYHRTSGIWQPVWLETVPAIRIEDIRWTFERSSWSVGAEVSLNRPALPGSTMSIELELDETDIALGTWSVNGRQVRGTLDLRGGRDHSDLQKLLWSPERPTLIGATVRLTAPGSPEDVVHSCTGFRTVETDERHIMLNGEPLFLRMVLSQGYWPESHLAAPSADAIRREVELVLNLGFNGARLHQKVEDPRLLFWADSLGLLLWGEIGSAFTYSDRGIDRHAREWREAVLRDRNHPSIIAWVPFNESWGVDDVGFAENQRHAVRAAYHATHQLDGTRPVIGNDGWENVVGDLLTAHDYSWDRDRLDRLYGSSSSPEELVRNYDLRFRRLVVGDYGSLQKPVVLSEFGGVSYAPDTGEEWFGYGVVRNDEEFVETYRNLVETVSNSSMLAGFCYTQLTDTLQETNGLLTQNRTPKVDINVLHEITSGGPSKQNPK